MLIFRLADRCVLIYQDTAEVNPVLITVLNQALHSECTQKHKEQNNILTQHINMLKYNHVDKNVY